MFQENSIETCILSRVKQITSPGRMHETSAQTWCTGKTQRDRVEREVGGGTGMGNTCKSMADSCQCMMKTLQYCKEINLQLIKINGNKKRERERLAVGRAGSLLLHLFGSLSSIAPGYQLHTSSPTPPPTLLSCSEQITDFCFLLRCLS